MATETHRTHAEECSGRGCWAAERDAARPAQSGLLGARRQGQLPLHLRPDAKAQLLGWASMKRNGRYASTTPRSTSPRNKQHGPQDFSSNAAGASSLRFTPLGGGRDRAAEAPTGDGATDRSAVRPAFSLVQWFASAPQVRRDGDEVWIHTPAPARWGHRSSASQRRPLCGQLRARGGSDRRRRPLGVRRLRGGSRGPGRRRERRPHHRPVPRARRRGGRHGCAPRAPLRPPCGSRAAHTVFGAREAKGSPRGLCTGGSRGIGARNPGDLHGSGVRDCR